VAHPRANGQVERANRMIIDALKKKVFDKSEKLISKWIRELLYVVWSLRTQPSRALHGNTPFFMVYGSEAVLLVDLIFGAHSLTLESIAEAEATRMFECRHPIGQVSADSEALPRQSGATPILCSRRLGTLSRIDRRRTTQTIIANDRPFIVAEVTRPRSYRLTQMDGTQVGNSWNIEHLKKFYP
jgi:hypothetical protein